MIKNVGGTSTKTKRQNKKRRPVAEEVYLNVHVSHQLPEFADNGQGCHGNTEIKRKVSYGSRMAVTSCLTDTHTHRHEEMISAFSVRL